MGRPLKISKYSAMSGIFTTGPTAQAVSVDVAYPPFAAPTSLDTATVVLPQPATTPLPWTGVVGGINAGQVSATYPVVSCTVNILLATGAANGSHAGGIIRQKGARKFLVQDYTAVQDESIRPGNAYKITSLGTTDWQALGAPAGAVAGDIFTATVTGAGLTTTGVANLVGTCVLYSTTPTGGNMAITMSIANSTPVYISKITNKFVQDFNGGEVGGGANTGDVWNYADVVDNIDYAANFFVDGEQFAKSGAEVTTWSTSAPVNSQQPGNNGTLLMAEVAKTTS
jgi:hypothetical protein